MRVSRWYCTGTDATGVSSIQTKSGSHCAWCPICARPCSERRTAPSPRETAALRRKIALVSRSSECAPLSERYMAFGQRDASAPLQVMMHPLLGDSAMADGGRTGSRRVLITLSSPDHPPSMPAQLIGQVFGLSPAESRVAAALCSGLTIY